MCKTWTFILRGLCHASHSQLLASCCRGLNSFLGQAMWDLWWVNWEWCGFLYSSSNPPYTFSQCITNCVWSSVAYYSIHPGFFIIEFFCTGILVPDRNNNLQPYAFVLSQVMFEQLQSALTFSLAMVGALQNEFVSVCQLIMTST